MDTSVDNSPANEWELSKENVQPLKSGRKVASLTAALQPLSTDQNKIREQKQLFEAEVRTYTGDDPLDVWHRYIEWTEQNFPKGGKTSQLSVILERCVSLFKHDDRYKNDQRYLDAWIKFSKICNDPLEIYNFIYNLGIGGKLTTFYKAWAWELEQTGNTKKADAIYMQGIQNGAEPLDQLRREHSEFQARVAQKLVSNMAAHMDDGNTSPSRSALGELRTTGSKHKVPVNRVDAVKPSSGGFRTTLAPIKSNTGPGFQVFHDENEASAFALPKPSGEWKQMGARSQVNRENEQKPGIWSNVKVKQRNTGVVPVSAVSSHSAPNFEVHADEDVDHALMTPRKITQVDQILSSKKEKNVDPFQNIQQQPQNKKEIVMYCKNLIYGGAEEFSFEELRAARLRAKQKREQNRIEQLQKEQELLLQKQKEEMQRERERLLQQQELLEQQRWQMQQAQEQLEKERQQQLQKNQIMEQQLQQQLLAKMRAMEQAQAECVQKESTGPTNRCLAFNTSMTKQAANMSGLNTSQRQAGSRNTSYHTPNLSFNTTSSGGSARVGSQGPTPDSSGFNPFLSSGSGSKNSSARTSLVAPSPTVNTKEALQVVMGMFNQTLEIDREYGWGHHSSAATQEHIMEADFAAEGPANSHVPTLFGSASTAMASAPFEIFQENPEPAMAPSATKKEVDLEDKENVPCKGYQNGPKRTALSGILQASTDIHCVPLEEQEAQHKEEEAMEQCDIQPRVRQEEEFMEGVQEFLMPEPGEDMTFAPAFSSTRNFTDMARLASTPFNQLEQPGSLPAPPLSTIKPVDQMPQANSHADHTVLSVAEELKNDCSMARGLFGEPSRVPGPPPPESFEASEVQAVKSNKKLSPILEGSDELMHCNNTTGSTMCATSQHCTTLGSSYNGPNSHNTSTHHHPKPLPPVKEIQNNSFAKPESVAKPVEKDNPADQTYHEIDVTNYLPADFDVKASPLCTSVLIDPYDPFDEELLSNFLSQLPTPISSYPHYHKFNEKMPKMRAGSAIKLGNERFQVEKSLGEGGFAKIYQACSLNISMDDDLDGGDEKCVLKVQHPGCPWEFYITTELHHRLEELQEPVNVRPSIMTVDHGYFYTDGSCLVNQFHINGTLLDLVNLHKKKGIKIREPLVMYLAIEMLHLVHQMQKCNIIHGDIKPDNFLIRDIPTSLDFGQGSLISETKVLKLIDFGRSIDMKMFPDGTTFMAKVNTSGFECIEMKTDRPWTFQTDLFGVVGTIHVMMFSQYMKVYQEGGQWRTTSNFKRSFKASSLWKNLFDDLLNVRSCQEQPDLAGHIAKFEQYFQDNMTTLFAEVIKTLSIQLFEEH